MAPEFHQYGVVKEEQETRYFYGWVVVTTAALGLFLGVFPIVVSSFTVFFPEFVRGFHAGRGAISLAFSINNTVGACMALVVGRLCDRMGARPVILTSLSVFGVALIATQAIGSRLWELYLFFLVIGIVSPGTNSVAYGLVVSRWFSRRRGLALGLMMIGLGAGAIVVPPLARMLIAAHGWRATYARFGCAALLIALPAVAIFLKEWPQSVSSKSSVAKDQEGYSWREIRGSHDFWLMVVVFMVVSASVQGCFIHLGQLMAAQGAAPDIGAFAVSVSGAALLAGRLGTGYLLDRFRGPTVARVIFASVAVGIGLLGLRASVAIFGGAFLVGLGLGAEADIIAYFLGRYFGLRSFGTAFGCAFGLFVLAGGLGPLGMGIAFDQTGSYRLALTGFCLATMLGAVFIARLGPYRFDVGGRN